jgi:hypothetical protein
VQEQGCAAALSFGKRATAVRVGAPLFGMLSSSLMHASFDYLRLHVATLVLTSALACGTRADEHLLGDGGPPGTGGSGTGGAGGASGNGGAGTGGSAGTIISGDSGTCGCVGGHVGWGWDGGHVIYHETSALEVCNLFVHQRMPVAPSPPVLFCEQVLGDCAGAIGAGNVWRSIAHADVQAAIAAAPILYGEDPRAYDGQVLRIEVRNAVIEVGQACRNAACKPIPAGVDALGKQLVVLTKQELAREPCSRTFPPPN